MATRLIGLVCAALMVAPALAQDSDGAAAPDKAQTPARAQTRAASTTASPDKPKARPPAHPQNPAGARSGVRIELNKLKPVSNACRVYLVARNRTGHGFSSLRLDLVMFNRDAIVARRLAVEIAPLPAGKMSLKVFDIPNLKCRHIGRILLNGVLACRAASGKLSDCLQLLSVSSRSDVLFIK